MKSILITGASTGFGMGTALEMAKLGWSVYATMRNLDKADRILHAAETLGVAEVIQVIELDVTSQVSVDLALASVLEATGGQLDVLLNNAGYSVMGAFEELTEAQYRQQMETNFFGALRVTQGVLPSMRKAGQGRIVTVSSNSVNCPHPMLSIYAASKWALEGWSEGLAMEMAPYGVEVSIVQPGAHRTPFAKNVQPNFPDNSPYQAWFNKALPGVSNLDRWGRDPEAGIADIVAAITAEEPRFHTTIGADTELFHSLKGNYPFEIRALLARLIAGLPSANEFVDTTSSKESIVSQTNVSEIIETVASSLLSSEQKSSLAGQEAAGLIRLLAGD